MGHYRHLYESQSIELEAATTALRASKAEELRLTLALKETNSRVTRERERAENLQRELLAKTNECQQRDASMAEYEEQIKALQAADWHTRYHAAMARVDELEAQVKAPTVEACDKPHVERQRLPNDRLGKTFKLRIGLDEKLCPECKVPLPGSRVSGHLTLNRYPDGRLGEMFLALDRARRGDLAATFAHQFAIMVSIALQYHVPQKVIVERLKHVRDESGGYVIREEDGKLVTEEHAAGSLIDLIAVTMERFAEEVTP
jgi:hypothetical protein